MKLLSVLLLLSVAAECKPQFGSGGASLPLAAKKNIQPKLRENAKRVMLSYGPLAMPGVDVSQPKEQNGIIP
jgi:hypothetical protein